MRQALKPSGVVTLTTDFGLHDPFVGVLKGSILRRLPSACIIDLTHDIRSYGPAEAGFWLDRSFEYFPIGTVHVAVVDPGVGTARDILAAEARGHLLLAPDNGLLGAVLARAPAPQVVRVSEGALSRLGITAISATFHGRDIFAPLAAELAAGRATVAQLGEPAKAWVPSAVREPTVDAHSIAGCVITIDHFGNLITNIHQSLIARLRRPQVRLGIRTLELRRTYGEARPGEYVALVNAFEMLEIARVERSAAEGLSVGEGTPVTVFDGPPEEGSPG